MRSPFPGMDPFIESYKWSPFHTSMIVYLQEEIVQQLPGGYFVEAETSLYVTDDYSSKPNAIIRPDVSLLREPGSDLLNEEQAAVFTPPTSRRLSEAVRHRSLSIRDTGGGHLVTSIELLSPANKHGAGLERYRLKREQYQLGGINLVEIDLLRGGTRADLTTTADSPYLIQVLAAATSEILEWQIGLLQRLPVVPVPLLPRVEPLKLDLQEVFTKVYRLSSLGRRLRYELTDLRPVLPEGPERDEVASLLTAAHDD